MGETDGGMPPTFGRPKPAHQGGVVDEHGRAPGAPSRVGTGTPAPPADPERVRAANTGQHADGVLAPDRASRRVGRSTGEPGDGPQARYELIFSGAPADGHDLVVVTVTGRKGPGGHPVYEDATGIIQAEISDHAEVRILATGAGQQTAHGVTARPLT
ncbi:DUF6296 family protein [Streptomyces sp. NPDC057939]|uniref:DUF6296 family protein n=1 Tax=Streptomyces sp. NPDC057939 TaxID=3346284 RepID=UPI0036EB0B8A